MRLIAEESDAAVEGLKTQFVDHYGGTTDPVRYILLDRTGGNLSDPSREQLITSSIH